MNTKNEFTLLLHFFQYCGIFSVQLEQRRRHPYNKFPNDLLLIIWCIINIQFIFLILYLMWWLRNESFHVTSTIGRTLDIVQVLTPILTHLMMLSETIYGRNQLIKIWNIIERLDINCSNLQIKTNGNQKLIKEFLIKCLIINLIGLLSETFIISSIYQTNFTWTKAFLFRLWSFNIVRQGTLQLVLYTELIGDRLNYINLELIHLSRISRNGFGKSTKKNLLWNSLKNVKEMHNLLWILLQNVNFRFGWSIVFNFINNFICITIGLYWVYARIRFNHLNEFERMENTFIIYLYIFN